MPTELCLNSTYSNQLSYGKKGEKSPSALKHVLIVPHGFMNLAILFPGSLFFWYNTLNVKNKVRYDVGVSPKIFQHFAFIFHYLFWFHIVTVPNTTRFIKFRHLLDNSNRDVKTMENDCRIICFNYNFSKTERQMLRSLAVSDLVD